MEKGEDLLRGCGAVLLRRRPASGSTWAGALLAGRRAPEPLEVLTVFLRYEAITLTCDGLDEARVFGIIL